MAGATAGLVSSPHHPLLTSAGEWVERETMAMADVAAEQDNRNPAAIKAVITALTAAFGNRVVTSQAVREQHGNTVTWIVNQPPDAVVYPQSTEEVQQVVRICGANG